MKNASFFPVIEPLESRIAPAALFVSATKATYTDVDGDLVTVRFSEPVLTPANVNAVLITSTPAGGLGDQLERIYFDASNTAAEGTDIKVRATPQEINGTLHGDGFANVGRIDATAGPFDLGVVRIHGDLGEIDAGTGSATISAVKILRAHSIGAYGMSTQDGTGDLASAIRGSLDSLIVATKVKEVTISVFGLSGDPTAAKLGSVKVGGSLIAATIFNQGDMGAVTIGRDLQSTAQGPAEIYTEGKLASAIVGGSIIGIQGGPNQSSISSLYEMGPVEVGGDILFGFIHTLQSSRGTLASLTIGGSCGGAIQTANNIGPIIIGGDLQGTTGGLIQAYNGTIASVTIGGSVIGGPSTPGFPSGGIIADHGLGPVNIKGDVRGGSGEESGFIGTTAGMGGKIESVTIGGSLVGGSGSPFVLPYSSGEIYSDSTIGKIEIGGNLRGGTGDGSGWIQAVGLLRNVAIHGSLIGGSNPGGTVTGSGGIVAGRIGTLKIDGNVRGASVSGSDSAEQSAYIASKGRIAHVIVGGSIITGTDDSTSGPGLVNNATIRARDDIGSLFVGGDVTGNDTQRVLITARGQAMPTATTDLAIGKITISGNIEQAEILAGFDFSLMSGTPHAADGNAQIGAVKVGGDWIASNISAGVDSNGNGFGNANDSVIDMPSGAATDAIVAKIASIMIGGTVTGTASSGDHFGFVAQQIGAFTAGGFTAPLTSATDAPIDLSFGTGHDVTLREI
jgi:hypothetical protein